MNIQEEKSMGCCSFVEDCLCIAVSQVQKVFSNIGRLGKIFFGHLAGK
jgi:hypothetical protein